MTRLTCQAIVDDFLSDYVEDRLPADTRAALEHHLTLCPDCVYYLHNFRATLRAAATAEAPTAEADEIPESLVQAILAARRAE